MDAPSAPSRFRPSPRELRRDQGYEAFARRAAPRGEPHTGRSHDPHRTALPPVVRTWPEEGAVLRALARLTDGPPLAPRPPAPAGEAAPPSPAGRPLAALCPDGEPVAAALLTALAETAARLTGVRREWLPRTAAAEPGPEGRGFLRARAALVERTVLRPHWPLFGGLFTALGVPGDALARYAERLPALTRRPGQLLHTELHRGTVRITEWDGGSETGRGPGVHNGHDSGPDTRHDSGPDTGQAAPRPVLVGWEAAAWGDPLHELATHLVRTRYPAAQEPAVVEAWSAALAAARPAAVHGLARDLPHHLGLARAQDLYTEVMRTAHALGAAPDPARLDTAATAVRRALEAAAEPLRLTRLPGSGEIVGALHRWATARQGTAPHPGWRADPRLPLGPAFGAGAVHRALLAEGAAPAEHVFKGTAHLNTVVRLPGRAEPVVVRRKLPRTGTRERRFLSEHAVLAALESSGVGAPRVLALGVSGRGVPPAQVPAEPFAIHTYVGPPGGAPPTHPVAGLLPAEADHLVDQLGALTRVECRQLDPAAAEADFSVWLRAELVRLVAELPAESQEAARELGLPGAERLGQILARHRVTAREPVLLHGDLNPWNLVRGPAPGELTVIDWEMAMIGDPLYDLVRHLHLTPARAEIRQRMFRRWEQKLGERYTRGWQEDQRVYRWIELVRSAYIDLDRLHTGTGLDAPNVARAVDSYAMTLAAAKAALGLPPGPPGPPGVPFPAGIRPGGKKRTAGIFGPVTD
ncbi:aminoglycoside phosphotransferase family protein [Streptomyces physcomitrii]|uniref:aminoglycoside phosphotransferase family protein n=1 Tax=Streptomyces physcomitrii TaxID=2724184 RepID=UPI0028A69FC0|nr:aminoglycoside phosphotransferase family protein [Streptomyces physcomitrii]